MHMLVIFYCFEHSVESFVLFCLGAERLIRHFHSKGIPLAVATSSSERSVQLKLKNYQELFSCIGHFVMGSSDPEVVRGKPNPDIFFITAKRFKDSPPPEKVFYNVVVISFMIYYMYSYYLFLPNLTLSYFPSTHAVGPVSTLLLFLST